MPVRATHPDCLDLDCNRGRDLRGGRRGPLRRQVFPLLLLLLPLLVTGPARARTGTLLPGGARPAGFEPAPRLADLARPPLQLLADSLAVLAGRQLAARQRGDLEALEAVVREDAALIGPLASALLHGPLPPAGAGRQAALRLVARLLRAHRRGAWIDSLAARAGRLPATDPDRPRVEFMLGVACAGRHEFAAAADHFERSAARRQLLAGEARVRGARALYRLLRDAPDAALRQRALALLEGADGGGGGELEAEAGLLAAEIGCGELRGGEAAGDCAERAQGWLARYATRSGAAIVRLLMAEALETTGDLEAAEAACIDLMARHPQASEAREAWSRYLTLRRGRGLAPEARARYRAAVVLDAQGARHDALRQLDRLLDDPAAADFHARAQLLKGKTLRRMGRHAAALAALARVRAAGASVRQQREADFWSARALWSAGRIDSAAERYAALAGAAGAGRYGVLAAWERARMLEDEGRLEAARAAFSALRRRYPRHPRAAEAAWRSGLCAYRLGDLEAAAGDFLQPAPAESGAARQRRLYWLGRVLLEQGAEAEARATLDQAAAIWPRDYYGWRAAARLAQLGDPDPELPVQLAPAPLPAPPSLAAGLPPPLGNAAISGLTATAERALARGLQLLEMGLADAARRDLRQVEREITHDPRALLRLATAYELYGVYDRAVSCGWDARQALLCTPAETVALRHLYPVAFPEHLFEAARRQGVDPLLALALMRRESRFHPEALSRAGARGLMQLMPRTAASVARQLRERRPSQQDLFEPETNLRLGTWYLASALRDYAGRSDQALASYNAGRRKVEEWQQASGLADPDLFVELIGYGETRNYVRKVLNDYFYYQVLYGPAAVP